MKLPSDALISSEKLLKYLLVQRPIGDKSKFLKKAGYDINNWKKLEQDLKAQILPKNSTLIEKTEYGELFEIRGKITGPSGLTLDIISIWIVESKRKIQSLLLYTLIKGNKNEI